MSFLYLVAAWGWHELAMSTDSLYRKAQCAAEYEECLALYSLGECL